MTDFKQMPSLMNSIYLLKDLKHIASVMVQCNGGNYRRYNIILSNYEYLAYVGHDAEVEMEKSSILHGEYERVKVENSVLNREAITINPRTQFSIHIKINRIALDLANPVYDVYLYHGLSN